MVVVLVGAGIALADAGVKTQDNPQEADESSPDKKTPDETRLPEPGNTTTVYFFWGDGCPHCAKEKPFLEELDRKHEDLEVKMYEVYNSKENQVLYQNTAEKYGTSARGVPGTFIGNEHWVGYSKSIGNEMEDKIEQCLEDGCEGPLEKQS